METESKVKNSFIRKISNIIGFESIRESLVMLIPVLLLGSFSLVFRTFPIEAYQKFIMEFMSGFFYEFFGIIFNATFGLLSIYIVISYSLSYSKRENARMIRSNSMMFSAVICFLIFSGAGNPEELDLKYLGTQGVFTAIICSWFANTLYCYIAPKTRKVKRFTADGVDDTFRYMMSSIVNIVPVVFVSVFLYTIMYYIAGVSTLQELFMKAVNFIFDNTGRSIWSALIFMIIQHVLWMFGIHGANVMEGVTVSVFTPALDINNELIAAGEAPTEIFSKQFFDVFVLMGGCGTTICLLIALLIASRQRSSRKLVKMSILPMVFNINEIMVFGLPIVYNPMFAIPFLLTPIIMTLTSYIAISTGLVPVITHSVEWTTPIILGGYVATGSVRGAILQIFNLCIGVLIYIPFIILDEKQKKDSASRRMNMLVDILKESEISRRPVSLTKLRNDTGLVARVLADELAFGSKLYLPKMRYQPQYDNNGHCIGVEALTVWEHPVYGTVYPPLIFKLAEEEGILLNIEQNVFKSVLNEMDDLIDLLGEKTKISVNVTGHVIQMEEFENFLYEIKEKYPDNYNNILIEITEQAALSIDESLISRLTRIKNAGYKFGIDDFSMGNTSIKYLQYNLFELVKLDGSIVGDVLSNARSKEIVASIIKLSKELDIKVLAEYVETKEQQKALEEIGCYMYQGYYFSKGVFLDELPEHIKDVSMD